MNAESIGRVGVDAGRRHDPPDRQPEPGREREVALVVGGHGHDRAGAVAGQHVVGDEDRDPLAVDRVDRIGAQRHAGLLAIGRQAVDLGPPAGLRDVGARPRPARSGWVSRSTSGCSGARTMKVAPNSVSGRVVKTRSVSPPGWWSSAAVSKSISAPSERPIQFVCWMRIGSGQSMPSKLEQLVGVLRSSAGTTARRSRFSTSAPQRQQRRSAPSTCSRASVPSLGHQSTGDIAR